jgi:MoxR-like ATPase
MLFSTTGTESRRVEPVLTAGEVMAAQMLVRQIPAGDSVVDAILKLVRSARPQTAEAGPRVNELVAWGPGPRASQALMLSVRARALLDGRFAPSVDDVIALAKPVLRHRMALTFTARTESLTIDEVIDELLTPLR